MKFGSTNIATFVVVVVVVIVIVVLELALYK